MRITLDTNQLVRALVRPPELATFVMAWEVRRFSLVCSPSLLEEYERVLAYPDIASLIYPELLRAFRSHLIQVSARFARGMSHPSHRMAHHTPGKPSAASHLTLHRPNQ